MQKHLRKLALSWALMVAAATPLAAVLAQSPKPAPPPARWLGLIGEYGPDDNVLIIFELDGTLRAHFKAAERERLNEVSRDVFKLASSAPGYDVLTFGRDGRGRATQVPSEGKALKRRNIGPGAGENHPRLRPLRPGPKLMKEPPPPNPPKKEGDFPPADLVELTKLDSTIRLEVRYATTNNF